MQVEEQVQALVEVRVVVQVMGGPQQNTNEDSELEHSASVENPTHHHVNCGKRCPPCESSPCKLAESGHIGNIAHNAARWLDRSRSSASRSHNQGRPWPASPIFQRCLQCCPRAWERDLVVVSEGETSFARTASPRR